MIHSNFFFSSHNFWATYPRKCPTSDLSVLKISTCCIKCGKNLFCVHFQCFLWRNRSSGDSWALSNSFLLPAHLKRRRSMSRNADMVSAEPFSSPSFLTHQKKILLQSKGGITHWDMLARAHSHTSQPWLRRRVPPFEPTSCCCATRDQYHSHVSQHPSLLHCQEPAGGRFG